MSLPLRGTGRSFLDHAHPQVVSRSARRAITTREMGGPSDAPKPKKCDFFEVDNPADLKRRRFLSDVGTLLNSYQDTVYLFPESRPTIVAPRPPISPLCARAPIGYSVASR